MFGSAMNLIGQIADPYGNTKPRIELTSQKPDFVMQPIQQPFTRCSPESQGIESERIHAYLDTLQNDETLDPHNVLIFRNGKMISEASFGAYDHRVWHITHSECKSITGLAIGMLIDEGRLSLDDKIVDIFGDQMKRFDCISHKSLMIRHLLTMSSGIVFNEAGFPTEKDWVKGYLESAIVSEPGKVFSYNSMNTYMLSATVRKITGEGLMEYLHPRLWTPLGISNVFWETCPMGIEKGGWGLYICPEDIAKVGQMVLQNGRWGDRQIVSAAYVFEATSKQIETPKDKGDYNYGYQIWVGRQERSFLFNGMFSQNVLGYFDSGILIVSNAGNNELFQQSNFYSHTNSFFGGSYRPQGVLEENPEAYQRLKDLDGSLTQSVVCKPDQALTTLLDRPKAVDVNSLCKALDGKTYITSDKNAASVSVYPLFAQVLQNNYTKGLKGISFRRNEEDGLSCIILEQDENYDLPVGFEKPKISEITLHGENQKIGVKGEFTSDEDGTPVLKLRVSFLELANTRTIEIYFYKDYVQTKWAESPGIGYLESAMDSIMEENDSKFVGTVLNKTEDELRFRMRAALEPRLRAELQTEKSE